MTPEQLVDLHEITRVKYRYLRALDTHQWELMRTCFTEDARSWYSSGRFSAQGADAIIRMLSGNMRDGLVSSHVATHPEIEFTSPTSATGVWRFEDIVHLVGSNTVLNGAGYYYDEYEKAPQGWLIKSTGYERIFELRETKPADTLLEVQVHPRLGVRAV